MQSYDSQNRQWRSVNAWRGNSVRQRIGYVLDNESPREHASSIIARKALRCKRIFLRMDQWSKKPHLIKNGIRIICNTENFVPIVVPGLSASSSTGSDPSTSKTLSRQESHCWTYSSSSSSSPTVSDTKTRQREDRIESDISQVIWSTMVDERLGRPDVDQANKLQKPIF